MSFFYKNDKKSMGSCALLKKKSFFYIENPFKLTVKEYFVIEYMSE